jgi:hypothetical protein
LLYVLAIICPVVGISHHLPPQKRCRIKQTLPPTAATQMMTMQMTTMQTMMPQTMTQTTDNDANDDTMRHAKDDGADDDTAMQTMDDNADNNTGSEEEYQQSQCPPCLQGRTLFSMAAWQ